MALVKCGKCGIEKSTAETACVRCAAKKTSPLTWIIGGIFAFYVAQCSMRSTAPTNDQVVIEPPKTAPAAPTYDLVLKTPAELATEKAHKAKVRKENAKQRRKEGVTIGMSEADVLASQWGKPRKINTTTRASGVRAQWVYGGGYLYFNDGVLVSIQN